MRLLYIIVAVIALSLCSYGQAKRVIDRHPEALDQAYISGSDGKMIASASNALEIVEISVEGKAVTLGQPFSAGDDWLKTLAIKVRNVSDTKICSIRIFFVLPETKIDGKASGFTLEYGKELSTGIDYGVQAPIKPGQEIVLQRNDRNYARDKEGIEKRSGITSLSSVIMQTGQAKFPDGTLWSSFKVPLAMAVTGHK